jgi:hypothetical protein
MMLYASPLPKHSSHAWRSNPCKLMCFVGKLLSILLAEGQVGAEKIGAAQTKKQDFGILLSKSCLNCSTVNPPNL